MLFKKLQTFILPFLLFLGFAILYIHNLSRSVYGGDVGDFVTASSVMGVAHPPGYPFFTLLGFLFIHIFPFFTPAFAMGLISSIAGACGIVVLFYITRQLTKSNLTAVIASCILGFSYLFWFYSEIAEIFALHSFLILLLFYLSILYDQTQKTRFLFFFSFFLGLAATLHQTIVFFIPSYLLILLPALIKQKKKKKVFSLAVLFAVVNAVWYIYIFIASSYNPVINWDHVHDISSFFRLILRQDYGTFNAGVFNPPTSMQRFIILRTYLFTILSQVTIPVIAVGIVGIIGLLKKSWRLAVALIVSFVISGPLFITYAGFPIQGSFYLGIYERFFVMSTLPIFIAFGFGLFLIGHVFSKIFSRPLYFTLIECIFLLIPFQLFFFNMPKTDLSQVYIGDMLGTDFVTPLPYNSILLVGGDTGLFNTWYMHYALHVRPDIYLINFTLISLDPYIQKEEKPVQKEFPSIKDNELIAKTLQKIAKKRPVYSYEQLQAPGKTKLYWIPTGMVYRLSQDIPLQSKEAFLADVNKTLSSIHIPLQKEKQYRNLTIADIPAVYAKSIWAVGNYILNTYKDPDSALMYYKKAMDISPFFADPYITSGLVYLTSKNDCKRAELNLQHAIVLGPYNEFPYFLLYTTYTECYHNKGKADAIIKAFEKEFGLKFFPELARNLSLIKK